MEEKKITVREIVDATIRNLMAIKAPVELIDDVIIPIRRAVANLELVTRVWDEEEKKKNPPADGDGPVLEIVPEVVDMEEEEEK